jgi:hypothetical protein
MSHKVSIYLIPQLTVTMICHFSCNDLFKSVYCVWQG